MPRKTKPDYSAQRAVAAILKMLGRPKGASAAEIAKARDLKPHTVRSIISRVESKTSRPASALPEGPDPKRGTVYRKRR